MSVRVWRIDTAMLGTIFFLLATLSFRGALRAAFTNACSSVDMALLNTFDFGKQLSTMLFPRSRIIVVVAARRPTVEDGDWDFFSAREMKMYWNYENFLFILGKGFLVEQPKIKPN